MAELNPSTTVIKRCRDCKRELPRTREHFYFIATKQVWKGRCIPCYNTHHNSIRVAWGALSSEQKLQRLEKTRKQRNALRIQILEAYGGQCKCCGESIIEFLTIDHVNNDGVAERASGLWGIKFYRHIVKANFPDNYQVLCYNCNCAKGKLGFCPHTV